jgi:sulfatase maturation enzyme AslB (radical SAM superfamily)
MKRWQIFPAWARILQGYKPFLSVEVTRECPLQCPGCYAYDEKHLNNGTILRKAPEIRGNDLVEGILDLIRCYRPLHLSIIGGEPLLRWQEMDILLARLNQMNTEVQFVTSAVRPIPKAWGKLPNVNLVVSVDGLPDVHDRRRAPASYQRILDNVAGQKIVVHCVILRSMLARPDYLREFVEFWSGRSETKKIWFSLYTPQHGEESKERLTKQDRFRAIKTISQLSRDFPSVYAPKALLDGYMQPPSSPRECIFAQTTQCFAPDLNSIITPCQLGGRPECAECGCMASAGLASIARFRLAGLVKVGDIFRVSQRIGEKRKVNNRLRQPITTTPIA